MKNGKPLAAQALYTYEMKSAQGTLLHRLHRDETVKVDRYHNRLIKLLRARAAELEAESTLSPNTVSDWLALELFARDRKRFEQCCEQAKQEHDPIFRLASLWIQRLSKSDHQAQA